MNKDTLKAIEIINQILMYISSSPAISYIQVIDTKLQELSKIINDNKEQ